MFGYIKIRKLALNFVHIQRVCDYLGVHVLRELVVGGIEPPQSKKIIIIWLYLSSSSSLDHCPCSNLSFLSQPLICVVCIFWFWGELNPSLKTFSTIRNLMVRRKLLFLSEPSFLVLSLLVVKGYLFLVVVGLEPTYNKPWSVGTPR